ncbi:hypothetical protein U1P98_18670 [Lysinibacillus irui]|uniref:Uncharacterized protein n=1 Tax=Lysinibacillus irui TaxID=2998077 RepID=A0ABU5NQP9_9BACI|nr:hypothetical protein [Lysinibacillus irui]MEA0556080.1 hypothetical protein [Lysinibacillus irui]MEA0978334.1 hypothetical protein [Lysinibacillus irui]MEA1044488.1 hypothetical protein [Lysinibacillus irui]
MANNRIKGITIELNGDTTGLTDALKDVNKESNKVTSELREVERALKFDPGNTELIAQKQQLLAEQIQNTSQKLDVLKEAQSQVEAQFRNGEIGVEQYRAFQRELATTEAQFRQYNSQMADTAAEQDRLARNTNDLQTFFAATSTDVNHFADALGTRLTSAIRDGSATTDQMNRALRIMGRHALGASVDIDQMREALRNAGNGANLNQVRQDLARITEEANQAGDAVNGFGQELSGVVAGLAAGGGIAVAIEKALDVSKLNTQIDISMNLNEADTKAVRQSIMETTAAIGDEEAAYEGVRRQMTLNKDASMESNQEIIKGASMISSAYKEIDFKELIQESFEIGKELKISQKDALALTNQLLSIGFPPEQLDIIAEYGGQLQRAGFDAKQVQGIMAAGVETGTWNIDNLLDGLKEGRIKAAEMGAGLSTSMIDALQIIGGSEEQFRKWGVAIAQGGEKGNKAFQDMTQYLMNVEDDVARNVLGVELFGTMWEDQGENIANTILNMDKHIQSADDMQKKLNEDVAKINSDPAYVLSTAMGNIKEALAPLLDSFAQFVAKIAEWVSNNAGLAAAIVAIVASIGILVGAFAALMPAIGGLVTAWPALAAIIGAIASPITLVVAAIVGLGIALVAAYQNSETFRENVNNVFQAIRDVAVTVFETVASFIQEKIAQIKQFWDTEGAQILQAVQNVFNGIKAVIEFVMPAVKLIVETVWNAIKQVIDGALNIIMGAIKVFSGLFTGDFSKMWEGVKQIFKGAIDLVVGWMTLSFFGGIKTIITNIAKTGVNLLKGMWDNIVSFFTSMGTKASTTVSNFSTSVLNFFKNLATNAGSTISNMVSSVINFVKNLATNFVNIISTMKNNVLNKMTEIKDGLINKVKSLPEQFTGIGKDIINGLIKGISAMTANVLEAITGVVDGVVNTAKKLLGIHSPSKEFMQIGLWTGEGLIIGLDQSAPKVNAAMENIGNGILAVSKSYQEEYSNLIDEFNKKNEDKNDKTLEKIYKIQNNAAKKKRALTQKEKQDIALLEASYRDNKMKSEIDFQKKYKALVEKSEKEYLEVIKNYIADKKSLDELSLVEEATIWEQSIDLFAEGTRERITAQKEYQKAVEDINKQIVSINSEYQSKIQAISDNLIKQEEEATKAYTDALKNREQALKSYAGTFDEFKIELNRTGLELMTNLQGQVDGFKQWQAEFEKLSGRGINKELLEELSALGVKALPELVALNSMTDEQLSQYSALYQEKSQLAREQAETELSGMKMDTQVKIEEMRKIANDQLTKLNLEWQTKIKAVTQGTKSELSSLKQIGVDAGNGLLEGLSSTAEALYAKAREIANNIANTIAAALDIHSPSRVTMGFGVNINEGLIKGMEKSSGRLQRAMNSVYGSLASSAEKSVSNKAELEQIATPTTTTTTTTENHYHMTFTSPKALDPYESARMAKNALKEMGLQFT